MDSVVTNEASLCYGKRVDCTLDDWEVGGIGLKVYYI